MASPSKLPDGRRIKKYPTVCPIHGNVGLYFYRDHFDDSNINTVTKSLVFSHVSEQVAKDFIYNGYPICESTYCCNVLAKPK